MAKANLGGIYAAMDFPPYEYREYPKHIVIGPHGQYKTAQNSKEEAEIKSQLSQDFVAEQIAAAAPPSDPYHEDLILKARSLQIPFNSRWSNTKLAAVIKEAEEAQDNLPAEENVPTTLAIAGQLKSQSDDEAGSEDYDALTTKARSLGVNVNRVWGLPRLRREIEQAELAMKE